MTASPPPASRLTAAINELEQALSALDQTVHAVSPSLSANSPPDTAGQSAPGSDMIPVGQVRDELVALQELVSGAAELIALARSGDKTKAAHPQETH